MNITLDDIFQFPDTAGLLYFDNTLPTLELLKSLSENYYLSLSQSGKSSNTIKLYKQTLIPLAEYLTPLCKDSYGIEAISQYSVPFLQWVEQLSVNKKYGDRRKRAEALLKYINANKQIDPAKFLNGLDRYFIDLPDNEVETSEYVIKGFAAYLGSMSRPVITSDTLRHYIENDGRTSEATRTQRRIALIAFYKYIDSQLPEPLLINAIKNIPLHKNTKRVKEPRSKLNDDDREKIINYLHMPSSDSVARLKRTKGDSLLNETRAKAMMALMMLGGLRASEALHVKYSDVQEAENPLIFLIRVIGKGKKERIIPIIKEPFEQYLSILKQNARGEYLSSTKNGSPMNRINLFTTVKEIYTSIGIHKSGLHSLRHLYGSTFAKKNGNINMLRQLLGHEKLDTTQIYSTVDKKALEEAITNL